MTKEEFNVFRLTQRSGLTTNNLADIALMEGASMTCENCGVKIKHASKLIQIMYFNKTKRLVTINICHACRLSASEVIAKKEAK